MPAADSGAMQGECLEDSQLRDLLLPSNNAGAALDTFQKAWTGAQPGTEPASGTFFTGFAPDPDDVLAFWLYPHPMTGHDIVVTYIGNPAELSLVADNLTLSDMWVDPLVNYVLYRAHSEQTERTSQTGAARAVERLAQQLNISRNIVLRMIGTPRRDQEQTR